MLRFLDPRFSAVCAVAADSDEDPGLRATCRAAAKEIAQQCGYDFAEALELAGLGTPDALALPTADVDEVDIGDGDETQQPDEPDGQPDEHLSTAVAQADDPIAVALKTDPARSDRDIARECSCSPTTVGRVRAALGLQGAARTVQRGDGRPYEMAIGERS